MSESVTAARVSIVIPAYNAATSSGQALIPRAAVERAASYVGFRREIGSAAAARRNARDCPPEARPVLEHKLASLVHPAEQVAGVPANPRMLGVRFPDDIFESLAMSGRPKCERDSPMPASSTASA